MILHWDEAEFLSSNKNIFNPQSLLTTHTITSTLHTCTHNRPLFAISDPPLQEVHTQAVQNRIGHEGQPWQGPGDQRQAAGEEWSPLSRCCVLQQRSVHRGLAGWLQAAQLDWWGFIQFSGRMGNEESVIIHSLWAVTHARNKHQLGLSARLHVVLSTMVAVLTHTHRNAHFQHFEYFMIVTSANSRLSFPFLKTVTEISLRFLWFYLQLNPFWVFFVVRLHCLNIGMSVLTW